MSVIGKHSVKRIVAGDLSILFYAGAVLIGLALPMIVLLYSLSAGIHAVPYGVVLLAIICGLIGDLSIRYCILKGALYPPVI